MADVDLSALVRLLAEPARARMCSALLGGGALSAGELARAGGVATSTASEHLSALLSGGFVSVTTQGRNRYYRLVDDRVAETVEYLSNLAPPPPVRSLAEDRRRARLRVARTCYDHLAGEIAVALADALVELGALADDSGVLHPTAITSEFFTRIGIDATGSSRRPLVRSCLDWTERRRHLAGRLGAALLEHLFDIQAVHRQPGTRAVTITHAGRNYLSETFGITP